MVTIRDAGVPQQHKILGYGDVTEHNHTMDDIDAIKRNQHIKDVVAASVQDGSRPLRSLMLSRPATVLRLPLSLPL